MSATFYSVPEVIAMIEKNGFIISAIVQTLTDIQANKIEQSLVGFGKGSFVVIKAKKELVNKLLLLERIIRTYHLMSNPSQSGCDML